MLGLLHGEGDFQRSLTIVNTSGWDTDCNAGNPGCLLGIRNGLAGIDAGPDWRGPVADRLYLPGADGGRAITDALTGAYEIVDVGRALAGEPPDRPKGGGGLRTARVADPLPRPDRPGPAEGRRRRRRPGPLRPVRAGVRLRRRAGDRAGPAQLLAPGAECELTWRIEDTGGQPVAQVGVELRSPAAAAGAVYLDWLTWSGPPEVTLTRPAAGGAACGGARGCRGIDRFEPAWPEPYRLVQNRGRGLLIQGTRAWTDYEVTALVTPHTVAAAGIGARVQGLRRYYALLLCRDDTVRLVKALAGRRTLAEARFRTEYGVPPRARPERDWEQVTGKRRRRAAPRGRG